MNLQNTASHAKISYMESLIPTSDIDPATMAHYAQDVISTYFRLQDHSELEELPEEQSRIIRQQAADEFNHLLYFAQKHQAELVVVANAGGAMDRVFMQSENRHQYTIVRELGEGEEWRGRPYLDETGFICVVAAEPGHIKDPGTEFITLTNGQKGKDFTIKEMICGEPYIPLSVVHKMAFPDDTEKSSTE